MILIASAVMATIVSIALLFPGRLLEWLSQFNKPAMVVFSGFGKGPGVMLLLLAAACVATAIGLLGGRKWARWGTMLLFATVGLGNAVSFLVTGDRLRAGSGVLICSLFLFVLTRRSLEEFCKK